MNILETYLKLILSPFKEQNFYLLMVYDQLKLGKSAACQQIHSYLWWVINNESYKIFKLFIEQPKVI